MKEKGLGVDPQKREAEVARLVKESSTNLFADNQATCLRQLILLLVDEQSLSKPEWLQMFWMVWNYGPREKLWIKEFLPIEYAMLCEG
jgi:hypothetical protein